VETLSISTNRFRDWRTLRVHTYSHLVVEEREHENIDNNKHGSSSVFSFILSDEDAAKLQSFLKLEAGEEHRIVRNLEIRVGDI